MAKRNVIQQADAPSSEKNESEPTPVAGFMNDAYHFSGDVPVFLNAAADPTAKLSWAIGQVEGVQDIMSVYTCATSQISLDPGEVVAPLRNMIQQALILLHSVSDDLLAAKRLQQP